MFLPSSIPRFIHNYNVIVAFIYILRNELWWKFVNTLPLLTTGSNLHHMFCNYCLSTDVDQVPGAVGKDPWQAGTAVRKLPLTRCAICALIWSKSLYHVLLCTPDLDFRVRQFMGDDFMSPLIAKFLFCCSTLYLHQLFKVTSDYHILYHIKIYYLLCAHKVIINQHCERHLYSYN